MSAMFKVLFVLFPRRLAVKSRDKHGDLLMRFVGWVWMQRAYLVNNLSHGWVAFVEDQTEEKLTRCPCCKQYLPAAPNEK